MGKRSKPVNPHNRIDSKYCPFPPQLPSEKQPIPRIKTEMIGIETATFREVQPFGKWRFVAILLFIVLSLFLYSIIVIIPISTSSMILGVLLTGSMVFAIIIFSMGKLMLEIQPDGLYYRYRPFHQSFRSILWNSIETYEVQTFRPLREWGGLGLRVKRGGRAYLVSGNRGVLIQLSNGKQVLIGSQRPEELAEAIAAGIDANKHHQD
ncbi:MAG: DUF6141 family protein [Promethearchaeota archaeon]